MNQLTVASIAAVAALTTACAPRPAVPPRPDDTAIRTALSAELAKIGPAIGARDAAALANLFTTDAIWILPDATRFAGRTNIESGARSFFGTFDAFAVDQISIDQLVVVNDSEAVTFSHSSYTLTEKGKAPARRLNPFADHWKKGSDGVWRVTYEINADGPAPTSAAVTH